MRDTATLGDQQSPSGLARGRAEASVCSRPRTAQALALQRFAGNCVTARVLARWVTHPDPDKKGVKVREAVAAEFVRFNPPKNV